jgi:hypothetical protein
MGHGFEILATLRSTAAKKFSPETIQLPLLSIARSPARWFAASRDMLSAAVAAGQTEAVFAELMSIAGGS